MGVMVMVVMVVVVRMVFVHAIAMPKGGRGERGREEGWEG